MTAAEQRYDTLGRRINQPVFKPANRNYHGGDTTWMAEAACRTMDPNVFFPDRGTSTYPAVAVCQECPVREACLKYSLDNHLRDGVYGGMSERQRRRLRVERRAQQTERGR